MNFVQPKLCSVYKVSGSGQQCPRLSFTNLPGATSCPPSPIQGEYPIRCAILYLLHQFYCVFSVEIHRYLTLLHSIQDSHSCAGS